MEKWEKGKWWKMKTWQKRTKMEKCKNEKMKNMIKMSKKSTMRKNGKNGKMEEIKWINGKIKNEI